MEGGGEKLKPHEYLEVNKNMDLVCVKCGHLFCKPNDNYKNYCKRSEMTGQDYGVDSYLHDHRFVVYIEYYCPGCYTLLSQEQRPPGSKPIPDFIYDMEEIEKFMEMEKRG